MKNITTLSLVTIAILGLTGCGGGGSSTPATTEVSSIKTLSNASDKHSKAEWDKIENEIQDLDKTEKFNTVLLDSTEKNIAMLNSVGVDKEEAYAINSDAMYDDLVEIEIEDLDNQVVAECKDDDTCKEEAYASLETNFDLDKEEAYGMAEDFRGDENSLGNDKLVKEFTCENGEVRTIQHYGFEDNFSTANGDENATASQQVQTNPGVMAYNNGIGLSNYDTTQVNRLFAEEIKNLPSNITKGMFYIGFENHGSNDRMTMGNMDTNSSTLDYFNEDVINLGWNQSGNVHYTDFSSIDMEDGSNLKAYANANQKFDVYIQDDTYVDFITVATCSVKNPIEEIKEIVNKFECNEKQGTLFSIVGGEIDALAPGTDTATPSNSLEAIALGNTVYPTVAPYDFTSYDYHFVDTLNLGLSSSQTVTKAEFNIGYKVIGSSLHTNDAIYIGDINGSNGNYAGGHLFDNNNNILTQPNWTVSNISNGEKVATVDLNQLNNNSGQATGKVGTTMNSKGYLDVYVQDDTAVDFTQLNLCVTDTCSDNAKDIKLDLSKLASWTETPSDARENSSVSSWDNTLNWFEFDQNQKEKILKIPFCACGDTIVNIAHLKGDNIAEVKLDSTSVAYQPWSTNGVWGFISDSDGGNHVDGSQTVTGTGLGVNHVLELNATNLYSSGGSPTPFGVALEGTLNFKGYLGKCK